MNDARTILIVDDDQFMVELVGRILLRSNPQLHLLKATSGKQALVLAEQQQPDAAIVDVLMPEMDGEELSKRLKARYPNLPIVILTGYENAASKDRLLHEIGVDEYLTKPMNIDTFYSEVSKLM